MTDRHQDRQAPEGETVGGVPEDWRLHHSVDQTFDVLSDLSGRIRRSIQIKEVSRQVGGGSGLTLNALKNQYEFFMRIDHQLRCDLLLICRFAHR